MNFGRNGTPLDILTDAQLENELQARRTDDEWAPAIQFSVLSSIYILLCFTKPHWWIPEVYGPGTCILLLLITVPALIRFAMVAIDSQRLPRSIGKAPKHAHVSGGALCIILLAGVTVIWGIRALGENYNTIELGDAAGWWVIALVSIGFTFFIFLPHAMTQLRRNGPLLSRITARLRIPLLPALARLSARLVSMLDSWLVHIVAPMAGATQRLTISRYSLCTLWIGPSIVLAWFLPAPLGLLPLSFSFLIAVAYARRWAWIELDREYMLRNPKHDKEELRVGIDQDLRDEALLALLSLILSLPIAMRQLHMAWPGEGIFVMGEGATDTLPVWLGFFGVELAKAVPFLDWADIYQIEPSATIQANSAAASHVVFGARAIVDLVFLAALIQAISISMRWAKHKRDFFSCEINILDRLIIEQEFPKLARQDSGSWALDSSAALDRFIHHDRVSLIALSRKYRPDHVVNFVAKEILSRQTADHTLQAEVFLELVLSKKPALHRILTAWGEAKQEGNLDVSTLVFAHESINGKPDFTDLRIQIIDELARSDERQEATTALRNIVHGSTKDTYRGNRLQAVDFLSCRLDDTRVVKTLERVGVDDGAKAVRSRALDILSNYTGNRNDREDIANITREIAESIERQMSV